MKDFTGRSPLEKHVQRDIIEWLGCRNISAVHVPNGSVLAGDGKQRAMQSAALKRAGMRPGFPDLILFSPKGGIGFIEVKRADGSLSDTQETCRDWLQGLGHQWGLARSVDDAEAVVTGWGWLS